jgi:predicted HTH domain antitoxin
MTITLALPDEWVKALPDTNRAAMEGVAVEGYRLEKFSMGQVAQLLGVSRWEAEQVLAKHGCHWEMTAEEIEDDVNTLRAVLEQKP